MASTLELHHRAGGLILSLVGEAERRLKLVFVSCELVGALEIGTDGEIEAQTSIGACFLIKLPSSLPTRGNCLASGDGGSRPRLDIFEHCGRVV